MKTETKLLRDEIVKILRKKYGWSCFHPSCLIEFNETDEVTIDHWIPLSRGGTWDIKNLRLMHKRCNALKSDTMPNADGSLPSRVRDDKSRTAVKAEICDTCMSGRLLLPEEECPDCGSGPQPATAPKTLQRKPKECDHDKYHCWVCFLDPDIRVSSLKHLLIGP